ncbi:unnamed protein product [Ectocarpus sp. 6 AP-2014]
MHARAARRETSCREALIAIYSAKWRPCCLNSSSISSFNNDRACSRRTQLAYSPPQQAVSDTPSTLYHRAVRLAHNRQAQKRSLLHTDWRCRQHRASSRLSRTCKET